MQIRVRSGQRAQRVVLVKTFGVPCAEIQMNRPTMPVLQRIAHDAQRGGPGAFGGLNSSSKADNRTMLNGYATFDGGIKLGAGYMRRTNDGNAKSPRSNLAFLGASYSTGPWVVAGEYYQLKYASNADKGQYLTVRTTYKFSKRTNVFASVGHMKNSGNAAFSASAGRAGGNPLPGGSQTAFLIGVQHAF